ISKLGQGKRIDRVEDVVDLGDELEVRVDDIDPQGKVSLSLASAPPTNGSDGPPARSSGRSDESRPGRPSAGRGDDDPSGRQSSGDDTARPSAASFEDFFEKEAAEQFGD